MKEEIRTTPNYKTFTLENIKKKVGKATYLVIPKDIVNKLKGKSKGF